MLLMQPLPAPCSADLIPDATGMEALAALRRQAEQHGAVFIAIDSLGAH
ncbi:hypothetical protein ACIQB5_49390 [Streptomyces sp. NPDC088560]